MLLGIILLLLVTLVQIGFCGVDQKVFELTQENPSYAFHGTALKIKGNITIVGCKKCHLLVTYSVRGCKDELGKKKYPKEKPKRVVCHDKLPFTFNYQDLGVKGCKKMIPVDKKFLDFIFLCSYIVKADQALVGFLKKSTTDFAIAVRVREWVDDTLFYGLLPAKSTDDYMKYFIMLLPPRSILTIVGVTEKKLSKSTYPDLIANAKFYRNQAVFQDLAYLIEVFAGSDPGNNTQNCLLERPILTSNQFFSNVITFTNRYDHLNLEFSGYFNTEHDAPGITIQTPSSIFFSSIQYPWIFAENADVKFVSRQTTTTLLDPVHFFNSTVRLTGIEGGSLALHTVAPDGTEKFGLNFDNVGADFTILASRFEAIFTPNLTVDAPRGYTLEIINNFVERYTDSCSYYYELTKEAPYAAVNMYSLANVETPNVCVGTSGFLDTQAVRITFCVRDQNAGVYLNRRLFRMTECPNQSNLTNLNQRCCEMTVELANREFYTIQDSAQDNFLLLLLQLETAIPEAFDIIPLSAVNAFDNQYLVAANDENTTQLIVILPWNVEFWTELVYLQWAHGAINCEYRLYSGAVVEEDPEKVLMTFRDAETFYPQLLTGDTFSIFIPPGCSPTLVFRQISLVNPVLQQCRGEALNIGFGYGDPMHHAYDDRFSSYEWTWHCFAPVDVQFQVVDLIAGELSIEVQDINNQTVDNGNVVFHPADWQTQQNTSYQGVTKITVRWNNPDQSPQGAATGFLSRIHFALQTPNTLIFEPTTTSLENCTKSLQCFFPFLFLIMLVWCVKL